MSMRTKCCLIYLATGPTYVSGELVMFEGTSFPEQQGWEIVTYCDPERWLEEGFLVERVQFDDCFPELAAESESYEFAFGDWVGASTFFMEFRASTDGPDSEQGGVSPLSVATGGLSLVNYQFVLSSTLVRFARNDVASMYFPVASGVFHTMRIEHIGTQLYLAFIDGELVDSGVPGGSYPTPFSVLLWRVKGWQAGHTTHIDYIRFGTIPLAGSGDFDSDDDLDLLDYYLFRDYSRGPDIPHAPGWSVGDLDADTDIDLQDFAEFQIAFSSSQ